MNIIEELCPEFNECTDGTKTVRQYALTKTCEAVNLIELGELIAQMQGVHFSVYHDFQGSTAGRPDDAYYLAPNTEFLKFYP